MNKPLRMKTLKRVSVRKKGIMGTLRFEIGFHFLQREIGFGDPK